MSPAPDAEGGRFLYKMNGTNVWKCHACGKHEGSNDKPFPMCSRCQCVVYCSKERQRKDWKSNHKARCVPISSPIVDKQIERFYNKFQPLIVPLCSFVQQKLRLTVGEEASNDFLVVVHLERAGGFLIINNVSVTRKDESLSQRTVIQLPVHRNATLCFIGRERMLGWWLSTNCTKQASFWMSLVFQV